MPRDSEATRESLLDAAEGLFIEQGYAGTSVDDVCRAAGVTKGAFFHHFASKHELALAAVRRFQQQRAELHAAASYQRLDDPLQRVYGFIDFLMDVAVNPRMRRGCLVGTLTQELAMCDAEMRELCGSCLSGLGRAVGRELVAAKKKYAPRAKWSADELAQHLVGVMQGSLLQSKATGTPDVVVSNLRHARRYVELLFGE